MLESILYEVSSQVTLNQLMACSGVSLALGLVLAAVHRVKNDSSRNFLVTLALLPIIIQVIIMMVNGNLGTGVAVMGAFSLVRFRSLPGTSREIGSVFLAMAVGLADGMGYIGIAVLLVAVVGLLTVVLLCLPDRGGELLHKDLRVTIPENLDYNGIFDDIFLKYAVKSELRRVKTVNMGSLYELDYDVRLKKQEEEKLMLDEIRCRNGNLTVVCGRIGSSADGL